MRTVETVGLFTFVFLYMISAQQWIVAPAVKARAPAARLPARVLAGIHQWDQPAECPFRSLSVG